MNKISYFYKVTKAYLTGDASEQIIVFNEKQSINAIKSKINTLEFDIVQAETDVDESKEVVLQKCCPTTKITNADDYLCSIDQAVQAQLKAELSLKNLIRNLEYYKELLNTLTTKVDAEK